MIDILSSIPKNSIHYVKSLIEIEDLKIKVVNKRKTKHGDFRKGKNNSIITINKTDNKYLFLLVIIHEFAHYNVFKKRIKTAPHGLGWKNEYKKLLNPVLNSKVFPNKLLELLNIHMISPRSSFSYDSPLVKELNKYDSSNKDFIYLDKIEDGKKFKYGNDKVYKKIKKRRKRYLCIETMSKRKYLFLAHAKVQQL
tara:strand:- start:170 stop:757 length:588 start_codon:yes stop_codon:yes gene_type:complete